MVSHKVEQQLVGLELDMQVVDSFVGEVAEVAVVPAKVFHRDVELLLLTVRWTRLMQMSTGRVASKNTPKAAKICEIF